MEIVATQAQMVILNHLLVVMAQVVRLISSSAITGISSSGSTGVTSSGNNLGSSLSQGSNVHCVRLSSAEQIENLPDFQLVDKG